MKCKKTRSSTLRHKLTLQQEIRTADDMGGYVRSWKNIADLWAEIIPVGGMEQFFANQLQASVTHRILLRYRPDITANNRLLFEKRAFNIHAVLNTQERNEMLELLTEEGAAA
jgi:SPP1 family predicted phage head-tail adaptor